MDLDEYCQSKTPATSSTMIQQDDKPECSPETDSKSEHGSFAEEHDEGIDTNE
jgi:hypothetical protein